VPPKFYYNFVQCTSNFYLEYVQYTNNFVQYNGGFVQCSGGLVHCSGGLVHCSGGLVHCSSTSYLEYVMRSFGCLFRYDLPSFICKYLPSRR
jgi:hypothetical protein